MRRSLILLAAIVATPSATAQLVHPNQYAASEGVGNNSWPFRYLTGSGRYQQSYAAAQFPGPLLITELSFRYKDDNALVAASADFKMTLSYCATPWNGLSGTFATNVGAAPTVVFDGIWSIPAFSGDAAAPNPFTARLKLDTPFFYDPGNGDLLMDVLMRTSTAGATGSPGAFARGSDYVGVSRVYANTTNLSVTTGTISGYGLITEFTEGSISTYGAGCPGAGGLTPSLLMAGVPQLGQQVVLSLANALGGTTSVTLISAAQASVPIGGACTLLVQPPSLALVIPLGGSGPGAGSYFLPGIIPLSSPIGPVFFQAFVADPTTPVGLSASNGLRADIF